MDIEFIPLLLTKSVAIYAVDPKFSTGNLPPFFTKETSEKIIALRQQLLENPDLRTRYVAILEKLNSVIARESREHFFSFEEVLIPKEKEALNALRVIGSGELTSAFIKTCAANATKYIEEVEVDQDSE